VSVGFPTPKTSQNPQESDFLGVSLRVSRLLSSLFGLSGFISLEEGLSPRTIGIPGQEALKIFAVP